MEEYPNIFVSFASEDDKFIRKLLCSLRSQNIGYWDYSNPDEEIALGKKISKDLEQRISNCNYFIPVVSANSASEDKRYTHLEVTCAIESQVPILPIVLLNSLPPKMVCYTIVEYQTFLKNFSLSENMLQSVIKHWGNNIFIDVKTISEEQKLQMGERAFIEINSQFTTWYGAYSLLKEYKALKINPSDQNEYEQMFAWLCSKYLKIRYTPIFKGDPRLPFSERFAREIETFSISTSNHIYVELLTEAKKLDHYFYEGNWTKVEDEIDFFIKSCKHKFRDKDFYYPQIAKGVCELQLGHFNNAERNFIEAKKHYQSDENALCGLGCTYLYQHRYEEALNEYNKALKICSNDVASEIRYNILNIAIQVLEDKQQLNGYQKNQTLILSCQNILCDINFLEKFILDSFSINDKLKIMKLKGIAYYKIKNYKKALDSFCILYEKSLKSINLKGDDNLDEQIILEGFQNEPENSEEKTVLLSKYASIKIVAPQKWHVIDGEMTYLIAEDNNRFDIYFRDIALIIYYCHTLNETGQTMKSITILQQEAKLFDNANLYHHLANLYADLSRFDQALRVYETELCQNDRRTRQYAVEYALLLKHLGREKKARDICHNILNLYFKEPKTREDFYYDGFASYLLGDFNTAQLDYKRSGDFDKYYEELSPSFSHLKRSPFNFLGVTAEFGK